MAAFQPDLAVRMAVAKAAAKHGLLRDGAPPRVLFAAKADVAAAAVTALANLGQHLDAGDERGVRRRVANSCADAAELGMAQLFGGLRAVSKAGPFCSDEMAASCGRLAVQQLQARVRGELRRSSLPSPPRQSPLRPRQSPQSLPRPLQHLASSPTSAASSASANLAVSLFAAEMFEESLLRLDPDQLRAAAVAQFERAQAAVASQQVLGAGKRKAQRKAGYWKSKHDAVRGALAERTQQLHDEVSFHRTGKRRKKRAVKRNVSVAAGYRLALLRNAPALWSARRLAGSRVI